MASPSKEHSKAIVDAYKRSAFDRTRERIVASLEADANRSDNDTFVASIKERTWQKMRSDEERDPRDRFERSEEDQVEMLLKELDRYPVIDNLVDKLLADPRIMEKIKKDMRELLDEHNSREKNIDV